MRATWTRIRTWRVNRVFFSHSRGLIDDCTNSVITGYVKREGQQRPHLGGLGDADVSAGVLLPRRHGGPRRGVEHPQGPGSRGARGMRRRR